MLRILRCEWVMVVALAMAGCGASYSSKVVWEQDYGRVWDTAIEVIGRDYSWQGMDKETGKMETGWRVEAGAFRYEGERRKVRARLSQMKEGKVQLKLGVERERMESFEQAERPESAEWGGDSPDTVEAERLLHLIGVRLEPVL